MFPIAIAAVLALAALALVLGSRRPDPRHDFILGLMAGMNDDDATAVAPLDPRRAS